MKIKALKTGLFAHPQPCNGNQAFVEGAEYDVDPDFAAALKASKWAEDYVAPAEKSVDVETEALEADAPVESIVKKADKPKAKKGK